MTDSSTHLYSPGLVGIIATESSVSNINGEKGILSYRGYSIEELAKKSKLDGIEAHGRIGFSKMAKEHGFKEMHRHFEMEIA